MGLPELLVVVLCHLFHLSNTQALRDRARIIVDAATEYGVPLHYLAGVCWQASGMGTDAQQVSLCGARTEYGFPIYDERDNARTTARRLILGRARCGTWEGALSYAHGGWCFSRETRPWVVTTMNRAHQIGQQIHEIRD